MLAVDVPSGLDADTGACDAATPYADMTVTLGFPKVGLLLFPGAGRVGRLVVEDIGIPEELAADVDLGLLEAPWVASGLPVRPLDAHKGTFGATLVVAGSSRYVGAAGLASAAAVRSGAGRVTLATPRSLIPAIAPMVPEITYIPLEELDWGVVKSVEAAKQILAELPAFDSILIGCGLGQSPSVVDMVEQLLFGMPQNVSVRLIIDADGLNILSRVPNWWRRIQADTVVTPHPGELRRLTDKSVDQIEGNRVKAAREAATGWRKTVLLKGAYSVIATPDGRAYINPFANASLATAGTGDVLAGIIAGLMAQGLTGEQAAAVGAYVHGEAGDLRRAEIGDSGLAASDLLPLIPQAMRKLRNG